MERLFSKPYATRSNAVRAARAACRKALASPIFSAYEGPDYAIHPVSPFEADDWICQRFKFELRGPAADEAKRLGMAL